MKQEDRELLLKDICGRLPYGVKVEIYNHWRDDYEDETLTLENYAKLINTFSVKDIKPYLFPMSSMTKEQKKEYNNLCETILDDFGYPASFDTIDSLDWLNKNYFDYRGLIYMGLAIDATGKNIY